MLNAVKNNPANQTPRLHELSDVIDKWIAKLNIETDSMIIRMSPNLLEPLGSTGNGILNETRRISFAQRGSIEFRKIMDRKNANMIGSWESCELYALDDHQKTFIFLIMTKDPSRGYGFECFLVHDPEDKFMQDVGRTVEYLKDKVSVDINGRHGSKGFGETMIGKTGALVVWALRKKPNEEAQHLSRLRRHVRIGITALGLALLAGGKCTCDKITENTGSEHNASAVMSSLNE